MANGLDLFVFATPLPAQAKLMFLRRRLLSTAAAAASARGPPPIRVSLTESAGRGVFATRPVSSGELLHSAQPLVSHPSHSLLHEVR